jgi:hypothetical protein
VAGDRSAVADRHRVRREQGLGRGATEIQMLVEPWEDPTLVKIKAQAGRQHGRIDDVTDRG